MSNSVTYQSSDHTLLNAIIDEAAHPRAAILFLHGINSEKNEGTLYPELSRHLTGLGFHTFRFDFRCHGENPDTGEFMTIQGETEDFLCSLDYVQKQWQLPVIVIAASFGNVPLLNSYSPELWQNIQGLILLNPVLNLRRTFLETELPWAKKSFHSAAYEKLQTDGYFLLDNSLKIGPELMQEIETLEQYQNLSNIQVPILMIHGDQDSYVPYEITREYSTRPKHCEFLTVPGSDHGFPKASDRALVFQKILSWISQLPF